MLPRRAWSPTLLYVQRRQNSGFIKRVMDQVKEDLEKNDAYKKAREDLEKSGVTSTGESLRNKAQGFGQSISSKAASTKSLFQKVADQAREEKSRVQTKLQEKMGTQSDAGNLTPNPYVEQAREASRTVSRVVGSGVGRILDATKVATSAFDTKEGQTRHEAWVLERDRERVRAETEAKSSDKTQTATEAPSESESAGKAPPEVGSSSALVVHHATAWDRFGAKLGDMPFLSNMYDNPLFDRMFGETELAQSVREMKDLDPQFSLAEFQDEIEHIIAPHVVKSFLDGDRDTLRLHCAGPAFAAVDSSMKERARQKCYLDSDILLGPTEVELKGARSVDNSAPSFIWTFQTQQVNCLRDQEENVIEGAVDDIRTVYYAMALTRHPILDEKPEEAMSLEYRWQIRELAIVGNQQCW